MSFACWIKKKQQYNFKIHLRNCRILFLYMQETIQGQGTLLKKKSKWTKIVAYVTCILFLITLWSMTEARELTKSKSSSFLFVNSFYAWLFLLLFLCVCFSYHIYLNLGFYLTQLHVPVYNWNDKAVWMQFISFLSYRSPFFLLRI